MRKGQMISMAGCILMAVLVACTPGQTGTKTSAAQDFSKLKGMSGFSDK